ncbi:MAG: LysR family transcriptional regulator [Hypericibacter sp.]
MARPDTNRSSEMEVFVRIVERGGFSAAARAFRMTPSAVSKLVARLEARLGARLVNRSTRKLQLTPEGQTFYERSLRILSDMDEAEREAAAGTTPQGRVRVNSSVPFGLNHLLPLVPEFLARHPGVTLDIVLTDQVIDLLAERADVAIRIGPLRASRLVARKLGASRMVVVAAPGYLERHGTPRSLTELEAHNRIGFNFARSFEGWPIREGGRVSNLPALGDVLAGDGETARRLALAGVGLARLARFHVAKDIEAGDLRPVLEDLNPGDVEDIHAVFVGRGGPLPARVRAFIDYLADKVTLP